MSETEVTRDDPRGDATILDAVAAVKLVLAARDFNGSPPRQLDMIEWLLAREAPDRESTVPVRLFVAAIDATKLRA